jgi:hypothetical protein
MRRDYTIRKRIILAALGLLLAADAALAYFSWQTATAPKTPRQVLTQTSEQVKILKADVERARGIRRETPATQRDCERFERSMLPAGGGYSAVTSEMGGLARKAGVKIVSLAYHRKESAEKPFTQVDLDGSIEGDYGSVVRFVNELQRSEGLYIVDDLSLAGSQEKSGGLLRVNVRIRTFFRKAV